MSGIIINTPLALRDFTEENTFCITLKIINKMGNNKLLFQNYLIGLLISGPLHKEPGSFHCVLTSEKSTTLLRFIRVVRPQSKPLPTPYVERQIGEYRESQLTAAESHNSR